MSWKAAAYVLAFVLPVLVFARLVQDPDTGTATWDASRASGFAGYLLLWLSVMAGIGLHMRVRVPAGGLVAMLEAHRIVSTLALAFVGVHVAGLLLDPVVRFSIIDGLVPFTTSFRPVQVGMGTVGQWLLVVVLASTALSASIPYSGWRKLHYLSFPCYALALVHSITSGTDTTAPLAVAVYAATTALVVGASVVRLAGRGWVSSPETVQLRP